MFESVRFVALDINGTLIDGMYHPWSEVLEKRLGLRRRGDAVRLRLNEVQTGKISFEEAVSSMYVVEDFEGLRAVAFERYMADLRLRNGCIELLEALRRR